LEQKEIERQAMEEEVKVASAEMSHSAPIEFDRSEENREAHVSRKDKMEQLSVRKLFHVDNCMTV